MNTSLCLGNNCGSRPQVPSPHRTAGSGPRLCATCRHALRADLLELPQIYEDCESALLPRRNPALQRVSGSRQSTGILLDEEVITTRSGIIGFLASWSALVADERSVAKPARRHPAELATFLVRHLSWLVDHPAVADFVEEIARITSHAQRSAYTQPGLRIELGQCIHPGCTAPMGPTASGREGKRIREVRCTAGHTWAPHQWLHLSRQIQQSRHGRTTNRSHQAEGAA
ncbi:hypothetical protein [Streptomyces sp. NBC_01803]|uniref:hypothetical protein n=1 Tax=Streptomyces sp. NBC_01803 TaxID=2975946 RepID=UPI002DD80110|nr:hypothetical protein [Streptomyces sp. NBC_01803]WSA46993.1 hypothetical protein OIE51_24125 [Streptomyces sp. NBC_01803]